MSPTPVEIASAVANLADELFAEGRHTAADAAAGALERLRQRLHSAVAHVWLLDGTRATRVLQASAHSGDTSDIPLDLNLSESAVSRLHRTAAVFCGVGEVPELEPLAPGGVRSYAVAACGREAVIGVLVLGWARTIPPCGDADGAQLRVASALLAGAFRTPAETNTSEARRGHDGAAVVSRADVTSAKPIELARRIARVEFDRLANSFPNPLWIAGPDGRITHANQRWADAIGSGAGQPTTDRLWWESFHPDDRRRARFAFRSAVSRRGRLDVELRMRASDGTYRWVTCVGAPRCAPDGGIHSYVGFCSDATAKRRVESAFSDVAGKLIRAEEAERTRIARELHDDVGQQVALLATKLETLAVAHRPSSHIRAGLAEARSSLHEISTSLHTLSHRLHPAKLKLLGLTQTLECLCRDVSAESRVQVTFEGRDVPPDLSEDSAVCIFRVAQEAVQNAVKHSDARRVSVQLLGSGSHVTLRVTDSGRGFDPLASPSDGIGLLTMRERVELVGGRLRIEAARGRGTTINVVVPVARRVA